MVDIVVPSLIASLFVVWIVALLVFATDATLDRETRDRWILPLVFLLPISGAAFLIWRRRAGGPSASRPRREPHT